MQQDYVKGYGYPFESHKVTTEDGYVLDIHRIPYGKRSSAGSQKPVAFIQHGILCSSMDWVFTAPDKTLGTFYNM